MKKYPFAVGLALAGLSIAVAPVRAQSPAPAAAEPSTLEQSPAPTTDENAAPKANGYTIMVKAHVNEKGQTESLDVDPSDDPSAQGILTRMAITMVARAKLPVREKDGHPIKYAVVVPYFFPVKDDEGPASEEQPKPTGIDATFRKIIYPAEEGARNEAGGVIVELVIDTTGAISRLTTLRASSPVFEKAVRDAVQNWKFHPAMKDGKPVETHWRLGVVFETATKVPDLQWFLTPRPRYGSVVCFYEPPAPPAAASQTPAAQTPAAAPTGPAAPTVQVPTPGK